MKDDDVMTAERPIDRLLAVMERLRDPEDGCPWDVAQDFASIAPYTVEEAYEVAEAIEDGDMAGLKSELGDLLLQVVFHAQMARESGVFDFDEVAAGISDKMIKRHPHVFAGASVEDADAQTQAWEDQKAEERAAKAHAEGRLPSALDDVAKGLPSLTRAIKLQKRAARVGFDWPDARPVVDKVHEEAREVAAEIEGGNVDRLADELGDLLFTCVNLSRKLGVDPESALRHTNLKFERRFREVERRMAEAGEVMIETDIEALEAHWQASKSVDRA